MIRHTRFRILFSFFLTTIVAASAGAAEQNRREWTADCVVREALLSLKTDFKVDESRNYSSGHSNGGGFTYLLCAERGETFAAFAPSGSAALKIRNRLKPKPVFHVAGENDPLVKYQWQKMMIETLKEQAKAERNDSDRKR